MNIMDFQNALHNPQIRIWFSENFDNLIRGGKSFIREDEITKEIGRIMAITNKSIQIQRKTKKGRLDIIDTNTNDIGEAANNATCQNPLSGVNHIIQDFFKRMAQGHSSEHFSLMYFMDIENLNVNSKLTRNLYNSYQRLSRSKVLSKKYELEKYLNLLPKGILIHEPIHNIKSVPGKTISVTDTTILNYDIYILNMPNNKNSTRAIYKEFGNRLKYFRENMHPNELL